MCGRSPRSVPSLKSHSWRPGASAMFDEPMKMFASLPVVVLSWSKLP
jgi:hypothetical protein